MTSKTTVVAVMLVVLALVLTGGYRGQAQPGPLEPAVKIGVVSINRVLAESQVRQAYKARQQQTFQDLEKELSDLGQQIDMQKAQLQTYTSESPESLELYKSMLENQAKLDALQKFYQNSSEAQERRWTEDFYQRILRAVQKVADQKGLALVVERSDPEFPTPSTEAFIMTVRTHKVLYSKGCYDITEEVTAEVDRSAAAAQP